MSTSHPGGRKGSRHARNAGPDRSPEHARTCVGCGVRAERPKGSFELVRFALLPGAASSADSSSTAPLVPYVDLAGSSFGRGAWVHPTRRCLEDAARRGFARSARGEVAASAERLALELSEAAEQRAHALVGVAVRSRKAAVGTTAVEEADSRLTLVAVDAAAQREVDVVKEMASGKALAFGTKRSLGDACGRDVVGVVAITDASLATAVRDAVALSLAAAAIRGL